MRDRMERLVGLPFSIGCVSQSSVAVSDSQPRKSSSDNRTTSSEGHMKSPSFTVIPVRRPNISAGIQKLIKGIKSLSQLFVVYKDEDEEGEMEIGLPTDVQHVGHIGWDGFNNVGAVRSWEVKAPGFLPLPSLSLKQFELAMAAQADHGGA